MRCSCRALSRISWWARESPSMTSARASSRVCPASGGCTRLTRSRNRAAASSSRTSASDDSHSPSRHSCVGPYVHASLYVPLKQVGRATLFASYNGVRSDSVQFFFPVVCRDHDHLYHGTQVNNQVPPL